LILSSRRVKFCPEARVFYRSGNTGSLSWKRTPAAIRSQYLATTLSTEYLLRAEDSLRTRTAAAAKLNQFVYLTYPQAEELLRAPEGQIASLGLPAVPRHGGGPLFRALSRVIGWKAAKPLRHRYYLAKLRLARLLEGGLPNLRWPRRSSPPAH